MMKHETNDRSKFIVTASDTIAKYPLASAALLMGVFSILIRFSLHNFALWGDGWWVLHRPYFYGPWETVKSHALRFGRLDMLYYLPMFKLAGFNARTWLLMSCLWLAASSLICGVCLRRSFPDLRILHVGVPLAVFFSPVWGPLIYRMDTDACQLCLLSFWLSVVCYQTFVLQRERSFSRNVPWLILGGSAYLYSLLCYEASIILFPAVVILLLPLSLRLSKHLRIRALVEVSSAMVLAPAIYMLIRYTIFGGGKDKPLRYVPRPEGFPQAARNAFEYLAAPLWHVQWDFATALVFLSASVAVGCLLLSIVQRTGREVSANLVRRQALIAVSVGAVLFVTGVSPFLLGKYTYDRVEFAGHGRIFSTAWYGFAIALTGTLSLVHATWFRRMSAVFLAVVVAGGAALIYDLHRDWETSADINARMWRDFFKEVPDVEEGTYFIFKDLYCGIPVTTSIGYRAFVNASNNGIREFIRMAYDDKSLGASYLYTDHRTQKPSYRTTFSGKETGIRAAGAPATVPLYPARRYILAERKGYTLHLVDKWTPEDVGAGVVWEDGAMQLETNRTLIKPLPSGDTRTPEERVKAFGYVLPPEDYVIPKYDLR